MRRTALLRIVRRSTGALALALAASAVAAAPALAAPGQNVGEPTVTVAGFSPTTRPLAGSSVTTTVTFDNADPTDRTGYGPYVELLFDSRGDDDGDGGADGLSLASISTAGASLVTTTIDCDVLPLPTHPWHRTTTGTPHQLTTADCPAGATLVVAALPFGSFTAAQPPVEIAVTFDTSVNYDMSGSLGVTVQGGYRFGGDELNNPTQDYPVRGNAAGSGTSASVTPAVMKLHKSYVGPEHETATGPSYARSYVLDLDVATGQAIALPTLQDHLPPNVVVTGVSASGGGVVTSPQFQAGSLPAKVAAGSNELQVAWPAPITGAAGIDRTVTVSFYVPFVDGASAPVLPGASDVQFDNPSGAGSVTASGTWIPVDPSDTGTVVTAVFDRDTGAPAVERFDAESIAVQKGWTDLDNDGVRDAGEPPIPGVTVALTGTDLLGNAVSIATTTNGSGEYQFTGLRPGTYAIAQAQPAGWIDGRDSLGDIQLAGGGTASGNRGVAVNDRFHSIVLALGESTEGTNYDFGELRPATIAGRVWGEQDGGPENGAYDAGDDALLQGVAIALTGVDDLGGPVSRTTTTNASGEYSFANLRPGTYSVVQTQPADWATGGANLGSGATGTGAVVSTNEMGAIVLSQDDDAVAYDFWELVRVDVAIDKQIVPARPVGGQVGVNTTFTWRVRVTNNGPSAATNVQFADDLAPLAEQHLVVTAVAPRPGTACGGWAQVASPNLTCTTAVLARGASTHVDLTVRVDGKPAVAPEDLVNDVAIAPVDQVDTDPSNDTGTDQVVARGGDVGVVKTGSVARASVGDRFTWTLAVTNHGPGADPNVTLHDQLPPRALLEQVSTSKGACAATGVTGAAIDCAIGAMAPGETVTVTVGVLATEAGNYRNVVAVAPAGIDEDPTNNASEHTVVVTVPGAGECTVEGDGTIVGGSGDEVICGGPGPDVIECGGGSNTIIGGGGNDVINCVDSCDGANTILGGAGNDVINVGCDGSTIDGGDGDDVITVPGSGGSYTLCGGSGNDVIRGGPGNDLIDGGPGNDRVYGGSGNDLLDGGTGNDRLYGGAGRDRLLGFAGLDLLFGENGNDAIDGGTGRDKAHGGNGDDLFRMVDRMVDQVIGGRGRDTLWRDRRVDRWTAVERVR